MKKFGMIFSILAIMAFIAVPAMAGSNSYKITGDGYQANGLTIMKGDVKVKRNGDVILGGNDHNGAFLSGGNTSKASFKDTSKTPYGLTGAAGATYGAINTNYRGPDGNYPLPYTSWVMNHVGLGGTPILTGDWKGSFAAGITAGGSFAYKGCNGFTKVSGEGSIGHATYATRGNNSAWTNGSASYTYKGKTSGDFIAGGGVASTGGYSGISVSHGTTSAFAISASGAATGVTTYLPCGRD